MFIGRREDGTIYGQWSVRQWAGQEELPDDAPEVLAFVAAQEAKIAAAQQNAKTLEQRIAALEAKGA